MHLRNCSGRLRIQDLPGATTRGTVAAHGLAVLPPEFADLYWQGTGFLLEGQRTLP